MIDVSTAFDTVDLHKLLMILSNDLYIGGTVYDWFNTFLIGQRQKVKINDVYSDFRDSE